MKITQGIPEHFKETRLASWNSLSRFWRDYAHDDSFHLQVHARVQAGVLHHTSDTGAHSVIDLGCGSGELLVNLRKARRWANIAGVDFCPTMIARAKRSDFTGWPKIRFHIADIEDDLAAQLHDEDHVFDCATSVFVVDEAGLPAAFFRSAAAVLREGAIFICATLDYQREMLRYGADIRVQGVEGAEIVISKGLLINGTLTEAELFRVLRHPDVLKEAARAQGFQLLEETVFDPVSLGSRQEGPGLHLLCWQKRSES
ncbi:class I SAM-dependent DNA methyltransferase [Ferribacterium limneticum]|uniref:class I SAM-dependent DNA methyltransferase n=1 Tax=Ferribacterium limneticum TaxID=76259 RepID=UPI001CF7F677|nr:class I SAM-dependent methyltransferase [Ferribacterium limneticum]UCV22555.1 class I SAM-dependent methyltransferase [Ferribacterium limneticum]